jgi:hypothetical protein
MMMIITIIMITEMGKEVASTGETKKARAAFAAEIIWDTRVRMVG